MVKHGVGQTTSGPQRPRDTASVPDAKATRTFYRQIKVVTSSRLNNTPPIGAPKATDTPAAAAADKTYDPKLKISAGTTPFSRLSHFSKGMLVFTKHLKKKLHVLHIQLIKNEVQFVFTYFESKHCGLHLEHMVQMLEQAEGLSSVINPDMYFIPYPSLHPQYSQSIN